MNDLTLFNDGFYCCTCYSVNVIKLTRVYKEDDSFDDFFYCEACVLKLKV